MYTNMKINGTVKNIIRGGIIGALVVVGSWSTNLYKLTNCDFESGKGSTNKCEVVHIIGLIPVVSLGTMWVGDDNE